MLSKRIIFFINQKLITFYKLQNTTGLIFTASRYNKKICVFYNLKKYFSVFFCVEKYITNSLDECRVSSTINFVFSRKVKKWGNILQLIY